MKAIPVKIYTEFNHEYGLPKYETAGAAGMDVRANKDVIIPPKNTRIIPTGIFVDIPAGYEIQVRPRSGMSLKTPLRIANSPGTIDCITNNVNIKTEVGYKKIDWLIKHPYTKVYSYNEELNIEELDEMIHIWPIGEKEILQITFDDGTILECTKTQFILTEYGWTYADNLNGHSTIM